MNNKEMAFILRRAFSKNYHKEAVYWWRKYLAVRRRNKNLQYQVRQLRKALFERLRG
jgi:hypothetical protein